MDIHEVKQTLSDAAYRHDEEAEDRKLAAQCGETLEQRLGSLIIVAKSALQLDPRDQALTLGTSNLIEDFFGAMEAARNSAGSGGALLISATEGTTNTRAREALTSSAAAQQSLLNGNNASENIEARLRGALDSFAAALDELAGVQQSVADARVSYAASAMWSTKTAEMIQRYLEEL